MTNIYKYPLELTVQQTISGSIIKVLDIQLQNNEPYMWAMVDTDSPETEITVFLVGTGSEDTNHYKLKPDEYLSTMQIDEFVFHWFYRK